ncbi:HlyD family secretion protein [Mesorhizobium xinjiangense]|uniref:HlyD family secretion protein n=1 Tax=Mesorhizobium xinjiangense TaxID=2678685 RepID=UPI0012ECFDA3|nr:HlyD family secretion protein [Mesorhizobium xinjiangense]
MNAIAKPGEVAGTTEIEDDGETLPEVAPGKRRRRGTRIALMIAVPLAMAVGGLYVWATGGRYQETDNAYLHQPKVSIASDLPGRIVRSNVSDNAAVKAGDVLFVVDPEPYRIAMEQAEAALAAARLEIGRLRAAYSEAVAQERVAASEVDYNRGELERQKDLSEKGISSRSTLDEARRDLTSSLESHSAAEQAVAGALAALGGNAEIETDSHPTVLSALAARDQAAYDLEHTTVRAPADGVLAQASSFRTGQYVGAGSALFALVEVNDVWVDANFKETQLSHMLPGQKAEIEFDTYSGRSIEAEVESIGAGTGAEFSLLPAQNATGNWVKVTQRIPVRLKVTSSDSALALRTGMSAVVTVDTGHARGLPNFAGLFGAASAAE